jgi:hypothetical protein
VRATVLSMSARPGPREICGGLRASSALYTVHRTRGLAVVLLPALAYAASCATPREDEGNNDFSDT